MTQQLALVAVATMAVGVSMSRLALRSGRLLIRRSRRCPSCGRLRSTRVCRRCGGV